MTSAAHKEGEETEAGARVQREREGEKRGSKNNTRRNNNAESARGGGATVGAVAWSASLVLNWGR